MASVPKPAIPTAKPASLWKLLGIPYLIFHAVVLVSQMLSWTQRGDGFWNGVFVSVLTSFDWVVIALPWGMLVHWIYRRQGWLRFRKILILAPALFLCGSLLMKLCKYPPTPAGIFHQYTKVKLPGEIHDLSWWSGGGGFDGFAGDYSFRTENRAVTEQLIRDLDMTPEPETSTWKGAPFHVADPGFKQGEKLTVFRVQQELRFITLFTNQDHTRIYLIIFPGGEE